MERLGFETWLVTPSREESDGSFRAAHPNLDTLPAQQRLPIVVSAFAESAATRAVELVPPAEQWRPDVVARTGARHIVHGFGLRPAPASWKGIYGPGFARLCHTWQVPELAEDFREATYLDICPPSLRSDGELAWRRIQALRPAAGDPAAGGRLPQAIGALPHPRSIYLSLGTIFHESPGVLETAIAGLRELPFNLIVTSGPGSDPARFGPQPPHVLIEPFIPLALLLPHCHLVVSHGGAGTMLGALARGLPQLMLPMGADQFMNAQACESAQRLIAPSNAHDIHRRYVPTGLVAISRWRTLRSGPHARSFGPASRHR